MNDENKIGVVNDILNLPTSMSKRQLKKVKKREKWLERKVEKRLGIPIVTRAQRTKFHKHLQLFFLFKVSD